MSYLPETTNKPKNDKPVKEIKKNELIIQNIKIFLLINLLTQSK
ncbi:Uncharacterised protein [Legionella sainthelensi]|nr:Uncharacterised protein [Legionella sainthelensi]